MCTCNLGVRPLGISGLRNYYLLYLTSYIITFHVFVSNRSNTNTMAQGHLCMCIITTITHKTNITLKYHDITHSFSLNPQQTHLAIHHTNSKYPNHLSHYNFWTSSSTILLVMNHRYATIDCTNTLFFLHLRKPILLLQ